MDRLLKRTVLVLLATLALVACTSAPLKPAAPIAVPAGVSQAQVKTSIINALEGRGWTLDNLADGEILSFGPRTADVIDAVARAIYAPQ